MIEAMNLAPPLDMTQYRQIVFLTGAGISAASGLRTYRGADGLWKDEDVAARATAGAFARDPLGAWRLFGPLRRAAQDAQPNPAHAALAKLEQRVDGASVTIITQNVDGLHQRAGSRDVIEFHGSVHRTRCSNPACALAPFDDHDVPDAVPLCPNCGAALRPDVVLFDEPIPGAAEWRAKRSLRDCDLFVAIGTSGTVSPAANFVRSAEYAGAHTVLVNLEPMEPRHSAFQREILGRAEEIMPRLFG
jgi:NAD-dependent deacetylase